MILTEKTYEQAKLLAVRMHGVQDYDGFPYHKHLQDVEDILLEFGYSDLKYRIAAWLHDILEDTPVNYSDINNAFGEDVAEIVFCVTDEMGRNRKERKKKTLPKIASNNDAIIVKLADRIANIRNGIQTGHSMTKKYRQEQPDLYKALHKEGTCDNLWKHLDVILDTRSGSNIDSMTKVFIDSLIQNYPCVSWGGNKARIHFSCQGHTENDVIVYEAGVKGPADWFYLNSEGKWEHGGYTAYKDTYDNKQFEAMIKKTQEHNYQYQNASSETTK